jgi:uncharacterized membrane protein
MQHSIRWLTCILLVATLAACSSEDEEEEEELPEVDCTAEIPTFDEVTAFSEVCTNCHSTTKSGEARNGAPADINWDDYESAKANAEEGAHEVFEGEMPPEESNETLTTAQKDDLYLWALCGTPE